MTVNIITTAPGVYVANLSAEKKPYEDFTSLAQALQVGDMKAAQTAFQMLQKDIQNTSSKQSPFTKNPQIGRDMDALQDALASGDTTSAQKAFTTLKQDLQSAAGLGQPHHHPKASTGTSSQTASTPGAISTETTGQKNGSLVDALL
jgi:hypothetical protein